MAQKLLAKARVNKKDEFYTQYSDIQKELNSYLEYDPDVFRGKTILLPCDDPEWSNFTKFFAQNFENFGLKKLISTSFAMDSKGIEAYYQPSLFESDSPKFNRIKTKKHGKVFILERDLNNSKKVDINDLKWEYLEGDGDFRSQEVKKLRNEADIIITNPPFSLFREFFDWIFEANKKFLIIGNINSITYKNIFIKIKNNESWLGTGIGRWISGFIVPKEYGLYGTEARVDNEGNNIVSTNNCLWLTNLDHGRRHQKLELMSMEDNIKFNKKLKGEPYKYYDNYAALEVPFTELIPSDYNGVMGVPITFLDKYNPDQFTILGASDNGAVDDIYKLEHFKKHNEPYINGSKLYKRLFIKAI